MPAARSVRLNQLALLLVPLLLTPFLMTLTTVQSEAQGARAEVIYHDDTDEKVVALTFDAGSDRGYAGEILDLLMDEGIQATFGMTGVWAERNPDLIERMADEGHQLINHSWNHASFTGASSDSAPLTSAEISEQLLRTEDLMREIAGVELQPYFRPPYGDYDERVLTEIADHGYLYAIMWTVDSLGWNGLSAGQITQRVVDGTTPGGIILMHVGAASQDAAAMPEIIHQLRGQGYSFVTVHDMVEGTLPDREREFPETGFTVRGNFLRYWERFGGLSLFGYPISGETEDDGMIVQHFERARFEQHPEPWPERLHVRLGLLGNELTEDRTSEEPFEPIQAGSDDDCAFHPETGHRLCFGFRDYWTEHGGLAIFGHPISEEFDERNPDTNKIYTVQYFERARFEYHPENSGTAYLVLLGRLGAQLYEAEPSVNGMLTDGRTPLAAS